MFKNMAKSLVEHERIQTTEAKAKELRKVADRLVSMGLEDTVHSRRKAYRVLEDRTLVHKLFSEIAPRFTEQPGGYTRILKSAEPRRGDAASMAVIEFTRQSEAS
jgi:large subunit ribosomal protein L17